MNSRISPRLSAPAILLALCLAAGAGFGQYLEATIEVGGWPYDLLWNPTSNKVYCADRDDGRVHIIDGATNHVIDDLRATGEPFCLAWNSRDNKVYCSRPEADRVAVIDGVGDSLIVNIRVGTWPNFMVYCPAGNKIYVRSWDDAELDVIDGSGDSLLGVIPIGSSGHEWPDVWHAGTNHLFAVCRDSLVVVDCELDSVVGSVRVGHRGFGGCANPVNDLVYYACSDGVWAVSPTGDSVVAVVPDASPASYLCHAPYPNKLFAGSGDWGTVHSIDCDSHRVLACLEPDGQISDMLCDTVHGKVYVADKMGDRVIVIDARADTILKTIAVGRYPKALAWNQTDSRVYVANNLAGSISVIRDATGIEEEEGQGNGLPRGTVTVVHAVLKTNAPGLLLDVSGRAVMKLLRGENDVRQLVPGVYAVTTARGVTGRVVKVR